MLGVGSRRCRRKANRLVIFKRENGGLLLGAIFPHFSPEEWKFIKIHLTYFCCPSIELEAFFRRKMPTSKHFMVFKVYGHPWMSLTNPPAVCCDEMKIS